MYIRYLDILLPSDLNKRYINLILFENWCSIYLIKKKKLSAPRSSYVFVYLLADRMRCNLCRESIVS